MKRKSALMLTAALLLSILVMGWRTYGQSRPSPPVTQRGWDYSYDSASKSFPTAADKTKITFYDSTGWELLQVVREDYQTVLVFRRPKQAGK